MFGCPLMFATPHMRLPRKAGWCLVALTNRHAITVAATSIEGYVWLLSKFRHDTGKVLLLASDFRHKVVPFFSCCGAHFLTLASVAPLAWPALVGNPTAPQ